MLPRDWGVSSLLVTSARRAAGPFSISVGRTDGAAKLSICVLGVQR
jgi:hypothetical protein